MNKFKTNKTQKKHEKVLFDSIKNKIKNSGIVGNDTYGKTWKEKDGSEQIKWYDSMHESLPILHEDFIDYLKSKSPKSVLEVGCGTGYYPIKLKELFSNIEYTGTDISESALKQCRSNSPFEYMSGDFIKMNFSKKFDLVYSHGVIDHVYDLDAFASKIVATTTKFAYISSYRGFFPELKTHRMNWRHNEGSFYNDLSIIQLEKKFKEIGLNENEYSIKSLKTGNLNEPLDYQTIIKIELNDIS